MGKCTKDSRDLYYRSAKQEGWRARSAYKLLNLNKALGGALFQNVKRAVDLCAAPGSWSQVLSQQIYLPHQDDPEIKLVAVDFQFMVPIPGVIQFQGDITQVSTAEKILDEFKGEKADLVICDGAPDVTGLHDLDVYRHHDIVVAALAITTAILKEGGTMVIKVFKKKEDPLMREQISVFFREVRFIKPEGSRDSSLEHFAVCFGHFCPSGYQPTRLLDYFACGKMEPFRSTVIPFVIYGENWYSKALEEKKSIAPLSSLPVNGQESSLPSEFSALSVHDKSGGPCGEDSKDEKYDGLTDDFVVTDASSVTASAKDLKKMAWQSNLPTLGVFLKSLNKASE